MEASGMAQKEQVQKAEVGARQGGTTPIKLYESQAGKVNSKAFEAKN